jgi:predicted alpha/beta hydrolase
MNQPKSVQFDTADGVTIYGYHFASKSNEPTKGILLLAGATGVPQRFYRAYAEAASERGFDIVTLDYRGIGESAPEDLKGFKMRYLEWAEQDLAAALNYAKASAATFSEPAPIFVIGHSFGGHALGLLPNIEYVKGAFVFGVGAGWHGWMPLIEQIKVQIMWHLLGPILVKLKGYMGWSVLGMGEDLPYGVYRDWKRWCSFPHYFFDDPKMSHLAEVFARCKCDIVALNAVDDKWAQPQSRDAFFKGYSNAKVITKDLIPADVGMTSIDHMGYFKKGATTVWDLSFSWLEQQI